jgi:S1-C subfamily serine protease
MKRKTLLASALLALTLALTACGNGEQGATPVPQAEGILTASANSPSPTAVVSSPTPQPAQPATFRTAIQLPDISSVVERVKPAVVHIRVETVEVDFFLRPIPSQGTGTGIVISPDGRIVTNNHVVANAQDIRVTLPDGRVFPARVLGRDPLSDLAVIKIEASNLPTLSFADTTDLKVGDWTIAIGNALDLEGGPTVTVGVVSALGRQILTETGVTLFNLIQTDAAINPGNSGGPLLNLDGEVLGINTALAARGTGIGFAINAANARPIVDELVRQGRVIRPQLGIALEMVTPSLAQQLRLPVEEGALVTQVFPDTPAAQVGIRAGDVIISLNGQRISSRPSLQYHLSGSSGWVIPSPSCSGGARRSSPSPSLWLSDLRRSAPLHSWSSIC